MSPKDSNMSRASKLLWKRATPSLRAGSRAARAKIRVSGIPNFPNDCVIFIGYT